MTDPLFNETAETVKLWIYNNPSGYRNKIYLFQILPPEIHGKVLVIMYCVFLAAILYGFFLMATDKNLGKQERRSAGKKS